MKFEQSGENIIWLLLLAEEFIQAMVQQHQFCLVV